MKDIRNEFVGQIETAIKEALGFHAILAFGKDAHAGKIANTLNARIFYGVGHPNNPQRVISYSPKHIEVQRKLGEKPNVVLELYLTEIIQHWYDFLAAVYKKALTDNYYNDGSYQLSAKRILLDFSLKDNQLYDEIISKSVLDFDFLPAKEKLNILKKCSMQISVTVKMN